MFYSAETGGFYDNAIHGDNIPPGAVEISDVDGCTIFRQAD